MDTLKYNVNSELVAQKQAGEMLYAVGGGGGGSPVTVLTTLEIIELLKEAIEAWDAPAALKSLAERIHKQPYATEQQAWLALIEAASEHAISL
jgi:hypothetical protein